MDAATGADARAACTASYNVGVQSVKGRAERAAAAVEAARLEAETQSREDAAANAAAERYLDGGAETKSEPQRVSVEVVVKDAEGKETSRTSTEQPKSEEPPRN